MFQKSKYSIYSFPSNKVFHQSKLEVFADKLSVTAQKLEFIFQRVENIMGKERNTGSWYFSFSHNIFFS